MTANELIIVDAVERETLAMRRGYAAAMPNKVGGEVRLRLTADAEGRVTLAEVLEDTTKLPHVAACLAARLTGVTLPVTEPQTVELALELT